MIKNDGNGRYILSFDAVGVIRRVPLEKRGVSKNGKAWVLGGLLVEICEEGCDGSSQLYLQTWSDEMVEMINRIGVGKKVRLKYHIDCREYYDSYRSSIIVDDICMMTDGEDFVIGKGRSGNE